MHMNVHVCLLRRMCVGVCAISFLPMSLKSLQNVKFMGAILLLFFCHYDQISDIIKFFAGQGLPVAQGC